MPKHVEFPESLEDVRKFVLEHGLPVMIHVKYTAWAEVARDEKELEDLYLKAKLRTALPTIRLSWF